jgi:hypothetical protein
MIKEYTAIIDNKQAIIIKAVSVKQAEYYAMQAVDDARRKTIKLMIDDEVVAVKSTARKKYQWLEY